MGSPARILLDSPGFYQRTDGPARGHFSPRILARPGRCCRRAHLPLGALRSRLCSHPLSRRRCAGRHRRVYRRSDPVVPGRGRRSAERSARRYAADFFRLSAEVARALRSSRHKYRPSPCSESDGLFPASWRNAAHHECRRRLSSGRFGHLELGWGRSPYWNRRGSEGNRRTRRDRAQHRPAREWKTYCSTGKSPVTIATMARPSRCRLCSRSKKSATLHPIDD